MHGKPLLMVDVDGVISLYGFPPYERPDGTFLTVDGIVHFLSATAGEDLLTLAESYELVWCTGWEERANEYLPHALGLPRALPYLTFESAISSADHWKLVAIDAYAGHDRALAWIDDDLDERCKRWAAARPGPTLLVRTATATGITRAEVGRLLDWAAGLDPAA